MNRQQAALVELIGRYSPLAEGSTSPAELQKLVYFLRVAGERLDVRYSLHRHGPCSEDLGALVREVEGRYLNGVGSDYEPLLVLPGAHEAAAAVLEPLPDTRARIDRVLELVDGFESAYSLELLAATHWMTKRCTDGTTAKLVIARVQAWSPRKERMYGERHVRIALAALRESGWLSDDCADGGPRSR
ncbi:MAG: hypothetical protein ACRCYU_12000 [Nocardioides sp.]